MWVVLLNHQIHSLFFTKLFIYYWTFNVSPTVSYEITLFRLSFCHSFCLSVCPSVCKSVRPSLTFLKIGSLVYSDIVHYNSLPWNLMTAEARFLRNLGPSGLNQVWNQVFWVWIILVPWNCIRWYYAIMSNI